MSNAAVIQVTDLRKNYGSLEAVRGISFEIQQGEVFGLLGPNGAGKTTTVEILEGLRARDGGTVRVCGFDPEVESRQLKERLGMQLQETALPEKITVEEALELFASFYGRRLKTQVLLDRFGLEEKRRSHYDMLSGGQRQRLALALALVNDPEVVIFDEPTAGLDPQTRREIYGLVARLREQRRTVLLTTHYIEEAEQLCDRVAIVDHGKVIAAGTPRQLVQRSQQSSRIEFVLRAPVELSRLRELEFADEVGMADGRHMIRSRHAPRTLMALMRLLLAEDNELVEVHVERPSLEDVFIELSGRRLRD
ncbi:MAG: ABC transporter ATP-binding protein [Acidobacteria bacterium]|nr:ABC transporter ATP-binding protein [Acidobacteriota bacterium]